MPVALHSVWSRERESNPHNTLPTLCASRFSVALPLCYLVGGAALAPIRVLILTNNQHRASVIVHIGFLCTHQRNRPPHRSRLLQPRCILLHSRNRSCPGICIANSYPFILLFVRHIVSLIYLAHAKEERQCTT